MDDIRVLELGDGANLGVETHECARIAVAGTVDGQHFDSHGPPQAKMFTPEHHTHAARTEAVEHAVIAENQPI